VIGVVERGDGLLPGMGAGDLDGVLDRFRSGVEQRRALFVVARGQPVERLGHGHIALVGRDHEAGVGELLDLGLDRVDHTRSAVADRSDCDAGAEVDQAVAVGVDDDAATGPHTEHRHRRADAGGDRGYLTRHQLLRTRSGNCGHEVTALGDLLGQGCLRWCKGIKGNQRESNLWSPLLRLAAMPSNTC
jgi:hypothetical protein